MLNEKDFQNNFINCIKNIRIGEHDNCRMLIASSSGSGKTTLLREIMY